MYQLRKPVATACCLCRGLVPGLFRQKPKAHRSTSLTALSLSKGGTQNVPWLPAAKPISL